MALGMNRQPKKNKQVNPFRRPQAERPRRNRIAPYYRCLDPLLLWTQVDRPVDWAAMFGRKAPLEVEIGFGNGEALVRRALENPDRDFIGIELAWASTKRALRRLAGEGVRNVRLVQVDAGLAFSRLFQPKTIDDVRSWFPVPWPKDRHEKRRLFSRELLRTINSRLVDGGTIHIVTDFEPFVEWVSDQISDTGLKFQCQSTSARFDTKYERKWQDEGQDIFHEILITKTEHLPIPALEDEPLITYHLDHFNPERFDPVGREGAITVKFREFIFDPVRQKAMLRAFVAEDKLTQDVWIRIAFENEHWRMGLAQAGHVAPTEGVRAALDLAKEAALISGKEGAT